MGRKYSIEDHEAYRDRVDAEQAAKVQARAERVEKETARRGFLREGGTEEQFEQAWPSIRDQARHQRALDRDEAARRAQRANPHSRI